MKFLTTSDRFGSLTPEPNKDPKPTRTFYSLFGDRGQDLFRHGLAEITPFPAENNANSTDPNIRDSRLSQFLNTSDYSIDNPSNNISAKEDPVMFGFDIIIRTAESPLFSTVIEESVFNFFQSDFVSSSNNTELLSRERVWENFKIHFFQFFRDTLGNSANPDNPSNSRFYYYLKKVGGLDSLVENNTGDSVKSFIDYGKDKITLEFSEDVTLRLGRMAQLYKTLYWSRVNGKTIIPENLLRFDCDIIVSEVRNFAKVKKILNSDNVSSNDLKIVKDNVNRYVYTLYECQLFFDKMPHPSEINLGEAPTEYSNHSISFIYKHSTLRVDNFDPINDIYIPLNNGNIDPFRISNLDRFLNPTSDTSSTGISNREPSNIPEVELNIIRYGDDNTKPNRQNSDTNSNGNSINNDPTSNIDEIEENSKIDKGISDMKKDILNDEIDQFKSSLSTNKTGGAVNDYRWGRPQDINKKGGGKDLGGYDFFKDSPYGDINTQGPNNSSIKLGNTEKQIEDAKSGAPKESWLNSDSPGARFAKRIANTGIAVVNRTISSRMSLLNNTLNKIAGAAISNRILPPRNIYESDFNGNLYLASKQVKDAFDRFVGESISDLFKK